MTRTLPPPAKQGGIMSYTFNYPAKIIEEDRRWLVTFPDFGWGATDGATYEEALTEASDLLRELITATIKKDLPLPKPSRGSYWRTPISPPIRIAMKAAIWMVFKDMGYSPSKLTQLNMNKEEAKRILNPSIKTPLETMERVLNVFGKKVSLSFDIIKEK